MTGSAKAKLTFALGVLVAALVIVGIERVTENPWLRVMLYSVVLVLVHLAGRVFARRSP